MPPAPASTRKPRVPDRLSGTLLLCCACVGAAAQPEPARPTLPARLFAEGDWAACRVESARALLAEPNDAQFQLLHAVSGLRLGLLSTNALQQLVERREAAPDLRAMAAYETAWAHWRAGQPDAAFQALRAAFLLADAPDLFQRAGCSLANLIDAEPQFAKRDAPLLTQLRASRATWTPAVQRECAPPGEQRSPASLATRPAEWLISFYQAQIAPAIGERCSLYPSCSHYALEALRQHGILGLTLYADRAVREPSVVAGGKHDVDVAGRHRYADPLAWHDWWFDTAPREMAEVSP
jgi:putative component of membrane protein insertase Oxa1/YidC/SpoIIIJ protein YidD